MCDRELKILEGKEVDGAGGCPISKNEAVRISKLYQEHVFEGG
jgi:hypothetical protein